MKAKTQTILHIEDDQDHARLARRGLAKYHPNVDIRLIEDGELAIDYLLQTGRFEKVDNPKPDIILLNLRLPKIDGLEVLQVIKSTDSLARIPVVVLTSSEAERDIDRAYELHADSFLVKPFDFRKFSEMMRDMGTYWLTWNRGISQTND